MTEAPPPRAARAAPDLASHSRWIQELARRLVADASLAEDLVQDTWVAALRSPPSGDRPLRGWLATVLRRRLSERRREDAGREQRERRAAHAEALPSTVEMVERACAQRDLVQAVLDLDEPFRTAILWRFFEDLPPRAIARRARVPVATVHSRIARGLALLRARLDARHGNDGRGWVLALLPVLRTSKPAWIPIGTLLLKTSTQISLVSACAAALVAAFVLAFRREPAAPPAPDAALAGPLAESRQEPPSGPARPAPIEPTDPAGRVAAAAPEERTETASAAPAPARRLRGEVLDTAGLRLAGVALRLSGENARERGEPTLPSGNPARPSGDPPRSGPDGRFEIPLEAAAYAVSSADPRWATVLAGSARIGPESLSIVVVAPRLDLAGTVVDESGAPLRGAELSIHTPRKLGADFGRALDASVERAWRTVSDDRGAFALADVPSIPDAAISVVLGGFDERVEPLPPASDGSMRIVLARPRAGSGRLAGIVVDPSGGLVPGARVSVGWESTFTDAAGRFELEVARTPAPARAIAAKEGFLPAVHDVEHKEGGEPAWPAEILLRLGGPPLRIAGRVLDGEGGPVAGARVWLEDPTYFGLVETEPVQVETLLGRKDATFWAFVRTQADGSFEIGGLLERTYTIRALDPRSLLAASSGGVDAGSKDVELRLPKDELRERVAGRVVTRDGRPVAGASVVVQRFGFSVAFPGGGTRDEWVPRPETKSDAEGRFEIRDVPRDGVELFVHGETILFWSMDLKKETATDDLRVVVNRRMHLQLELDAPADRADELRVLDAEGSPMILRIMRGESSFTSRKADVVEGRSQVLSTSEDARTLVLYKAGAEIGRVPLDLRPGENNVVRY